MGLLHQAGLATIYDRDIAGLNPLLDAMSARGMPVDQERRDVVSLELSAAHVQLLTQMQPLVPTVARRLKVTKRPCAGATERRCHVQMSYCSACGQERVTIKHPCFTPVEGRLWQDAPQRLMKHIEGSEWVVPLPFTPSNNQMKRYCKAKGYTLPVRDGHETADETALRRLALRHETDLLFPLILRYRELDKLLSTYVGQLT